MLKKLKEDIEGSMSIFGYQREDKEFNPHLTLGRVRSQKVLCRQLPNSIILKERNSGLSLLNALN